jgi:hypothetical protein
MFTQILDNSFNNTIRKHVVAFGSLFSTIYTQTQRSDTIEKRRVPISYGAKEKFIQKIIAEKFFILFISQSVINQNQLISVFNEQTTHRPIAHIVAIRGIQLIPD